MTVRRFVQDFQQFSRPDSRVPDLGERDSATDAEGLEPDHEGIGAGRDGLLTRGGSSYDLDDHQRLFLFSRADTIYGGSDEGQVSAGRTAASRPATAAGL